MLQQQKITDNSYIITAGELTFTIDRYRDGGAFMLYIPEKGKLYNVGTVQSGVNAIIDYIKQTRRSHLLTAGMGGG